MNPKQNTSNLKFQNSLQIAGFSYWHSVRLLRRVFQSRGTRRKKIQHHFFLYSRRVQNPIKTFIFAHDSAWLVTQKPKRAIHGQACSSDGTPPTMRSSWTALLKPHVLILGKVSGPLGTWLSVNFGVVVSRNRSTEVVEDRGCEACVPAVFYNWILWMLETFILVKV